MALDVFECKICVEDYDSQNHRPLSLDCGHTFCELCIQNFGHDDNRICPTCKKLTNKSTDQLACIFALIPSQESITARSNLIDVVGDKCNDHGCVLDRFCADCGEMVCRKCVKNSHATHRHEFIDDILPKDHEATLAKEFENKIKANINTLAKSMSLSIEMCKLIDELPNCKKNIEDWEGKLSSQKKLVEQHLKDWSDTSNKCRLEKYAIFKTLCDQWKGVVLPPRHVAELTSLTKKLEKLIKCATHLQELVQKPEDSSEGRELSNSSKLFLDCKKWRVENYEDLEGAISSVQAGKIPREIEVVSSPSAPIQNLHDVLNFFGSACADRSIISVKPLDTFWARSRNFGDLQKFIEKFSRKMWKFYGSPDEVVTLCRVNPGHCIVGVRLASMADVNQCSTLSKNPLIVSCIRSLPAAAGARMVQLGWAPQNWHFPDAKAGSVDWMISLMEPVMDDISCCHELYIILPRCTLSKKDFRVLMMKNSKDRVTICCEHLSLPASVKSNLDLIAKNNNNNIRFRWSIPLDYA